MLERVFTDHERTVNRVCWNPNDSASFVSASQDGSMKLFDYRSRQGCVNTFLGKSQAVRDVSFSPSLNYTFAAAFDSGQIQIWDIRKGMERSINAHQGLVLGIDWHPTQPLLASCARDKSIKVWDSNFKCKNVISTMASVSKIVWRAGSHGRNQLGSFASLMDFKLHLWYLHF